MTSIGRSAYQLSFQTCPVILNDGIAAGMPGGVLPIIAITEALNFAAGLLSGGDATNLDSFFAQYWPIGARLISQRIGKYPFANQTTAANATIANALSISLIMTCPARGEGGFALKTATMMAMQATFVQHNASGGTYTIATPSFFYTNCIFLDMRDVTAPSSDQAQTDWQMDFEQPLITQQQASQAQNGLMSKITGGTQLPAQPTWSGLSPTVGSPSSIAGPSLIPAASNTGGSSVANANFS